MTNFTEISECGFSAAFEKIVKDPNNAVHLIAYGLYKKHKREFAVRGNYKRWSPEIVNYRHGITQGEIDDLHLSAKEALHTFASTALTETIQQRLDDQASKTEQLSKRVVQEVKRHTQEDIKALREAVLEHKGFWKNLGTFSQNVCASVLAAILLGAFMTWAIYAQWLNPAAPVLAALRKVEQQVDHRGLRQADDRSFSIEPAAGPETSINKELLALCRLALQQQSISHCPDQAQ